MKQSTSHLDSMVWVFRVLDSKEPQEFGRQLVAELFSRVLFSFLSPSLATPLPPLFLVYFRLFLPLENYSVL